MTIILGDLLSLAGAINTLGAAERRSAALADDGVFCTSFEAAEAVNLTIACAVATAGRVSGLGSARSLCVGSALCTKDPHLCDATAVPTP